MSQKTVKDGENSSWAKGIDVITLFVEDLDVSKQFYQRVFGMSSVFEDNNSAVFNFNNILINLLKITRAGNLIDPAIVASRNSGSRFVLTIHVENVDMKCKELTDRGVTLLNGPMDRPWGIRTASFIDPSGYIWEIAK